VSDIATYLDAIRLNPSLPNFPHHSHLESETHIVSSQPMNICQLLAVLETLIGE